MKTWHLSRLEHLAFTEFMEMAEDAPFDPEYPANGSFRQRQRGGNAYWYYQRHAGMTPAGKQIVESRYAGKVGDPAVEERIADFARVKEQHRIRRRLIAMLRHAGLPSPPLQDQEIITAVAQAGIFRAGGVLVGPMAFQSYCGLLGTRMASAVVPAGLEEENTVLLPADSQPLDARPMAGKEDRLKIMRLPSSAEDDPGLHLYLAELAIPSALICADAVWVRVPDPARCAIHTIVVSETRASPGATLKGTRDRERAGDLIAALFHAGQTVELAEAWGTMWHGPRGCRQALAEGALALDEKPLTLLAAACHRFAEEPFAADAADPVGTLRAAL